MHEAHVTWWLVGSGAGRGRSAAARGAGRTLRRGKGSRGAGEAAQVDSAEPRGSLRDRARVRGLPGAAMESGWEPLSALGAATAVCLLLRAAWRVGCAVYVHLLPQVRRGAPWLRAHGAWAGERPGGPCARGGGGGAPSNQDRGQARTPNPGRGGGELWKQEGGMESPDRCR